MAIVYLIEVTAAINTAGTLKTFYLCSGLGYNHPTAPGYYEPRLGDNIIFERNIFAPGATSGKSTIGWGQITLVNTDNGLSAWRTYGFAGWPLNILIGDDTGPYSAFTQIFVGTSEQPLFEGDNVLLQLRDYQVLFDVPIQANRYGGTNVLPNGLDGVATDLQGQAKALAYGDLSNANLEPDLVNTSLMIYQVNDGAIYDVSQVYDAGIPQTKGAAYSSLADLQATAPASGQYRVYAAGGYFRLGSQPVGRVTCNVLVGANAAARTVAQVIKAIATGPGGLSSGQISSSDLTALDTANSAVIGLYFKGDKVDPVQLDGLIPPNTGKTITSALDEAIQAIGAQYYFDRTGILRIKQLVAPSGSPVLTLKRFQSGMATLSTDGDIVSIERVRAVDINNGIPPWRMVMNYCQNYTIQKDSDLKGDKTSGTDPVGGLAVRDIRAKQWRRVYVDDATIKNQFPNSKPFEFTSALVTQSDAQTEVNRRHAMYKSLRDTIKVTARFSTDVAGLLDLGVTVQVQCVDMGLSAGKLFTVCGINYDLMNYQVVLTLWG
jgi:hypothetical protein